MAQPLTYMAEAAITTIVDLLLPTNDQRRAAWTLADTAARTRAAVAARVDIDACVWRGMVQANDQPFMWPRIEGYSCPTIIDADPDDTGSEQVAGLPRNLKHAYAIQCAARSMRQAGADPTGAIETAAHRGVIGQTTVAGSHSVNLQMANSPWARIDPDAAQYLRQYRAHQAEAI